MLKGLLYGVLLASSLAMLLFFIGFVCWQLGLSWLMVGSYGLASNILLAAFAALLFVGCGLLLLALYRQAADYLSREHRALRRLIMLHGFRQQANQRVNLEKRQQFYRAQFKRQRLLLANNQKHCRELFQAINGELKASLEPSLYQSFYQNLKQLHKQSNSQAMLALRDQALCRTSVIG